MVSKTINYMTEKLRLFNKKVQKINLPVLTFVITVFFLNQRSEVPASLIIKRNINQVFLKSIDYFLFIHD